MALPGVRTVLQDRFYTLSRTDVPDGTRVAAVARRSASSDPTTDSTLPASYDAFRPRNEQEVVDGFGFGSELHRAYLELTSAGAARVDLIAVPGDTTDTQLYATSAGNVLESAFEAIEVAQSDIVVLWGRGSAPEEWENPATPANDPPNFGFYANNSATATTSFVKRVADHCKTISDRQNPCHAVLGLKPYTGASNADSSITAANLTTHFGNGDNVTGAVFSNLIGRDATGMSEDGHFVSVVAAEARPIGYDPSWGYSNGAATYAGIVSSLNSETGATNRQLLNLSNLRYVLTRTQQNALIDAGLVPFGLNSNRQAVVVDAQTFSRSASDYRRLSTLRIVFDAVQLVRQTCESYIGEAATIEHRNSMETAIRSVLRGMTVTGALFDSDFTVTYIARENKVIIDLVLRPAFEIRNIEISVAVQL